MPYLPQYRSWSVGAFANPGNGADHANSLQAYNVFFFSEKVYLIPLGVLVCLLVFPPFQGLGVFLAV